VGLPRFDKKESRNVELQHHGRRATIRPKPKSRTFLYPTPDHDAAYVHATYTDPVGPGPDTAAKLLHFLIDCDPSTRCRRPLLFSVRLTVKKRGQAGAKQTWRQARS
jgi:hypothetical protein